MKFMITFKKLFRIINLHVYFRLSHSRSNESREAPPTRSTVTSAWTDITSNSTQQPLMTSSLKEGIVELQWLEYLWNHESMLRDRVRSS